MAKKMAKGQFDLDDLRTQLNQMRRMGGLGALAGMIPGLKVVMPYTAADAKGLSELVAEAKAQQQPLTRPVPENVTPLSDRKRIDT